MGWLRAFIYTRIFFALLAGLAALDLAIDILVFRYCAIWPTLVAIVIALDVVLLLLAGAMFFDLLIRKPQ